MLGCGRCESLCDWPLFWARLAELLGFLTIRLAWQFLSDGYQLWPIILGLVLLLQALLVCLLFGFRLFFCRGS